MQNAITLIQFYLVMQKMEKKLLINCELPEDEIEDN